MKKFDRFGWFWHAFVGSGWGIIILSAMLWPAGTYNVSMLYKNATLFAPASTLVCTPKFMLACTWLLRFAQHCISQCCSKAIDSNLRPHSSNSVLSLLSYIRMLPLQFKPKKSKQTILDHPYLSYLQHVFTQFYTKAAVVEISIAIFLFFDELRIQVAGMFKNNAWKYTI